MSSSVDVKGCTGRGCEGCTGGGGEGCTGSVSVQHCEYDCEGARVGVDVKVYAVGVGVKGCTTTTTRPHLRTYVPLIL